jgi:DNA-binding transcriptional LysR family regulator
MELIHLRYFQAVATCGSLTAAAKMLRLSQPSLSVAMQNLEARLGTTLLLRDRNGVRLTATGEELLRHAAEVFALVDRAEQQIKGLESDDIGSFVIGCHESLGAYFLPGFMASFLRELPRIELSLWNDVSPAVQQAVVDRNVSFGLVVNPVPHPDLVIVELFHDAVDLFVAADAPGSAPESRVRSAKAAGTKRGSKRARESEEGAYEAELIEARQRLVTGPLIFAGRFSQWHAIVDKLASAGIVPQRRLACGDHELVKSLVLAGIGVAILPRRVANYGHEGKLRRLHPSLPIFPDRICLVYRADAHRTRAAMRVKDALVKYGRAMEANDARQA